MTSSYTVRHSVKSTAISAGISSCRICNGYHTHIGVFRIKITRVWSDLIDLVLTQSNCLTRGHDWDQKSSRCLRLVIWSNS